MALLLLAGALSACDRQSKSAPQDNATTAAAPTAQKAPDGEPAHESEFKFTVDRSKAGEQAPDLAFVGPDGKDVKLRSFTGKPLLVNLWATWCTPCVAEMPTLDAAAQSYSTQGLQILTVSQDSQGATIVNPFFAKRDFRHLKAWLDPENVLGFHYATGMLPTSVLYDAQGDRKSVV
jgi:thiol-disulfide isomerase/thioredoxin